MITTYNSKTGTNGQRLNLVVNEDRKELYFKSCNVWNIGNIYNELGIREVNRLYKEFLNEGYQEVKHSVVKLEWDR